MAWDTVCDSVCPVARALAVVGDRWTLLLMREMSMGVHRFDGLLAQTGMSPHLLTSRLQRLVHDGLVERIAYQDNPPRYEYRATEKGKELDPILMMLRSWERKWEGDLPPGEPAAVMTLKSNGKQIDSVSQAPGGAESFRFEDVNVVMGKTWAAEREAMTTTFAKSRAAKNRAKSSGAAPVAAPATSAKKAIVKTSKKKSA